MSIHRWLLQSPLSLVSSSSTSLPASHHLTHLMSSVWWKTLNKSIRIRWWKEMYFPPPTAASSLLNSAGHQLCLAECHQSKSLSPSAKRLFLYQWLEPTTNRHYLIKGDGSSSSSRQHRIRLLTNLLVAFQWWQQWRLRRQGHVGHVPHVGDFSGARVWPTNAKKCGRMEGEDGRGSNFLGRTVYLSIR